MNLRSHATTSASTVRARFASLAAALSLALVALPLTACAGRQATGDEPAAQESGQASGQSTTAVDTSGWKTLGDAIAVATDEVSWGHDDDYFVCVFAVGDATVRVVATAKPGIDEGLADLMPGSDGYNDDLKAVVGDLELVGADDISSEVIDQGTLDGLVGKTGKDLVDEGFAFESYFFYGGAETGVTMAHGNFAYNVTFDVTVDEDETEDEGAAVMDAKVSAIEFAGVSNAALDPEAVD